MSGKRLAGLAGGILFTLYLGAKIGPPIGAGLHKIWTAVSGSGGEAKDEAGGHHYYTCGMHPWVIEPKPGNCPICGMKLVPLDPAKFSGEVTIDPVVSQNIGVRVEKVALGSETASIRTVGTVTYDETRLADVNLKVSGWIEKLFVNYLGAPVKRGQPLFEIYSPELYAAEEEYLLAQRASQRVGGAVASGASMGLGNDLLDPARTKLSFLDVDKAQIAALEARGKPAKNMTVRSPQSGVVIEKQAFEGMKVTPGTTAYRIADLSRVWVMATVYEYQSRQIKVGQPATMTLTYLPGEQLEGKVDYVYPYLDQHTRQINVRLDFPNPRMRLKPGMYATVVFQGTKTQKRLLVSRSAVIDTGERQIAFVALGGGRFEPRTVHMGAETDDGKVEILDGLNPGDLAVVSGQFLIDSEARMREALARMMKGTPVGETTAAGPVATAPASAASTTMALPAAANTALGAAIDGYLAVGKALSSDTTTNMGVSARKVADAIDALAAMSIPNWHGQGQAAQVKQKALDLAAASTLDDARRAFASLSAVLSNLLHDTGVPKSYGQKLEDAHCPMYPNGNGKGSVWIQAAGAIRNPYFGTTMLDLHRLAAPARGGAMIARLIRWCAHNRALVLLLTSFLALAGIWSVYHITVDAIPDLSDVQVVIRTEYPGQAPQIVEDQVTYPLTTAMLAVPYAKVVRGYSMFGTSFVYIIFQDGTDLYWARSRVLEQLSSVTGRLPKGASPQLGPDATGVGWVYEYALVTGKYCASHPDGAWHDPSLDKWYASPDEAAADVRPRLVHHRIFLDARVVYVDALENRRYDSVEDAPPEARPRLKRLEFGRSYQTCPLDGTPLVPKPAQPRGSQEPAGLVPALRLDRGRRRERGGAHRRVRQAVPGRRRSGEAARLEHPARQGQDRDPALQYRRRRTPHRDERDRVHAAGGGVPWQSHGPRDRRGARGRAVDRGGAQRKGAGGAASRVPGRERRGQTHLPRRRGPSPHRTGYPSRRGRMERPRRNRGRHRHHAFRRERAPDHREGAREAGRSRARAAPRRRDQDGLRPIGSHRSRGPHPVAHPDRGDDRGLAGHSPVLAARAQLAGGGGDPAHRRARQPRGHEPARHQRQHHEPGRHRPGHRGDGRQRHHHGRKRPQAPRPRGPSTSPAGPSRAHASTSSSRRPPRPGPRSSSACSSSRFPSCPSSSSANSPADCSSRWPTPRPSPSASAPSLR